MRHAAVAPLQRPRRLPAGFVARRALPFEDRATVLGLAFGFAALARFGFALALGARAAGNFAFLSSAIWPA